MALSGPLIPFNTRLTNTVWLDVNSDARQNGRPDLLPDVLAINNSLKNLFRCPIGGRGRIFQPEYGTFLWYLLQEPFGNQSAQKIRASLIQSIEKWEPRIKLIYQATSLLPNYQAPGYQVNVAYLYLLTNLPNKASFFVPV